MTHGAAPGRRPCATTKVVLLAAGLGTRLRPITDNTPKCLVPIAGRPLLDYWFDLLGEAGLRDVLINTHHLREQVRAYIDQVNRRTAFRVTEAYEPELLGSAGTIHANRGFVANGDDCLIVYADNLSNADLGQFIRFHRSHGDPVTMMLFHTQYPEQCGIADLDGSGRIVDFVEKPRHPRSNLANAGVYAVTGEAYREIAEMDKTDLGFDVLPAFVGRMRGWVWRGHHRDIGNHEALRQAQEDAPGVFGVRPGTERVALGCPV